MSAMLTDADFRQLIEQFLDDSKMSPTALGWAAMRDPGFVPSIRKGRSPTLKVVKRVVDFMRACKAQSEASRQ